MYNDKFYVYRTFSPKIPNYKNDGWGRDSYIRSNNGGLIHKYNYRIDKTQLRKSLSQIPVTDEGNFSCVKLIPTALVTVEKMPFSKTLILY